MMRTPQQIDPVPEVIHWDEQGIPKTRLAVVELCNWVTRKGKVTQRGEQIAKTDWDELTPAARTVLTYHGIVK